MSFLPVYAQNSLLKESVLNIKVVEILLVTMKYCLKIMKYRGHCCQLLNCMRWDAVHRQPYGWPWPWARLQLQLVASTGKSANFRGENYVGGGIFLSPPPMDDLSPRW